MGHSLSSVISMVNHTSRDLASLLYQVDGLLVLAGLAIVAWATRGTWGPACWKATLGRVACGDPRNLVLCGCLPCGWCIMNLCCPWVCPKFHPAFRLRIIIVKARHLHLAALQEKDRGQGSMSVYAEVEAGNNPVKTTSAQTYNHPGTDTVSWNEPIDMVMYPSTPSVTIHLYNKGSSDLWLGSLNVPVDSIYEPPGILSEHSFCGRGCARLCHELCGTEYRWPFVRGAPRNSEWRLQTRQWVDHCAGHKEKKSWAVLGNLERTAMFSSSTVPPGQTVPSWARLSEEKFEAIQQVNLDGTSLREMPSSLQSDKDVVMAAVRQDARSLRYASQPLQDDPSVQRAAAHVPEPMILQVNRGSEDVGKLWVYFVMHGLDEDLPTKMLLDV
mmetsp:Transcript_53767/g.156782  ORF Transcript_53767/g.156782 Transcript_53767/m.156782 type:complete len:386 (+) Transcript_53767:88-1245(+)